MSGDLTSDRLVTWNRLEMTLRGPRLESLARRIVAERALPIELRSIDFDPGEMRVAGKARGPIAIPFALRIRSIEPVGREIRVRLEQLSAFGLLPIPKLLFFFAQGRVNQDGVRLDAATGTLIIELDRFLPSFVDVTVEEIRIIDAGILLQLGAGGADPPPDFGGAHD